ncbi:MAG: hypothetical protein ACK45B_15335 [Limisphaerales bacterium]|jgi:hypothetical protein
MLRLTKHEQLVLCAIFGLLLAGLAVKTWRLRQAPAPRVEAASATATPAPSSGPITHDD